MTAMEIALGFVVGFILGGIGIWFVTRQANTARFIAIEAELRSQLQQRDADLTATRSRLSESEQQRAAAQTEAARMQQTHQALRDAQNETEAAKERASKAEAQVEAARQQLADLEKHHARALADLETRFKALSAEALNRNNESFLSLARETLGKFQEMARGDLSQRQQAIESLIKPLHENLSQYQQRLQQTETQQSRTLGELSQQLRGLTEQSARLQKETDQLVTALKSPQARGRWGEITLQRVVELAGLSRYCDFETQVSTTTEEGRLRPDLVVRLPQGKTVVVDSKVPLKAYLEAMEATDESGRKSAMARHAQAVRQHMQELRKKAYWDQFELTPEFVVLFLPGESFFSAALEQDRELVEIGMEDRVLLATPVTLIALLRTVAASWQQHEQAENAKKIAEAGTELFDRVVRFAEHLGRIRKGLETAVGAYNDSTGSFERMLLPGARRLHELNALPESQKLPEAPRVEETLRPPPEKLP